MSKKSKGRKKSLFSRSKEKGYKKQKIFSRSEPMDKPDKEDAINEDLLELVNKQSNSRQWKPNRKDMGVAAIAVLLLVCVPTIIIVTSRNNNSARAISNPTTSESPAPQLQTPEVTATAEPTPTPKPLHPNDVVFTQGTQAPIVKDIQTRLMYLGYLDNDEPTDLYGPMTANAIKLFQRKHGLKEDGQLGQETYAILMSDEAKSYSVSTGTEGKDVYELQVRLRELDYISSATSYFGTDTESAVKKFQLRNNLEPDGNVGAETREMLYSEDAKANLYAYGEVGEDIEKYQNKLRQLGYLMTQPDGKFGDDTVAAVRRFQERNSLIADGYLGQQTRNTLLSDDAQANALMIGMSGEDVQNMQKLLMQHDYLTSADGYFGEDTQVAVKRFQQNNDLNPDGKVGAATLNVMQDDDAVPAPTGNSGGNTSGGSGSSGNGNSGNGNSGSGSSGGGSGGSNSGGSNSSGSGGGGGGSSVPSGEGLEAFISIAESRLGCTYVRGGKGPNTFDCSGFVYWCLNQAGVNQGYMTSATWQGCQKYQRVGSLSEVRRGDVISFKGHVGIALGGGKMIDASSSQGKVRIANLGSPYWSRNFVTAFRIF